LASLARFEAVGWLDERIDIDALGLEDVEARLTRTARRRGIDDPAEGREQADQEYPSQGERTQIPEWRN
jgi:hypothetical protein